MSEVAKNDDGLPNDWQWSTLGEVCEKPQYGWTTKAAGEGGLRLLRTTDITKGQINWDTVPFCSDEPEDKEKYRLHDGDIVVSRAGSVGVSYLLVNPEPSVFASYLIRFKPLIDRKYVYYFLQSPAYWNSISEKSAGIALQNVNASKLKDIVIPVSPPEQQKRIVSKIEELFSHIDAGIEALNKAKQLLKQYRQSVLKAAVTGELTKEWREARIKDDAQGSANVAGGRMPGATKLEPASQLLERILQERRQKWEEQQLAQFKAKGKILKNDKWKEKYKEPNNKPEKFFEEPEGWGWAEIGTITDMLSGHAFKKSEYSEKGIRLFQIANVSFGHTKWDEVEHLPEEYLEKWQHLSLDEGDILMALNRPLLSKQLKISRLSKSDVPAILYQRVGKFQFYSECISDYFLIYMQSHYYINRLEEQLQGVNIPFINKGKLLETPISVPGSIEEMDLIVEQVNSKLESIQRMNDEINFQLKKAEKNKQSILASAFSGSLVDNSLPVSDVNELLGAIKAQKQGGAKPRKSKQPAKVEENRALEEIITESFGDKEFTIEQLLQISTNGDEAKLKNELFEIIKKCSVKSSKLEMSFNEDMEAYVFRLYKGELG